MSLIITIVLFVAFTLLLWAAIRGSGGDGEVHVSCKPELRFCYDCGPLADLPKGWSAEDVVWVNGICRDCAIREAPYGERDFLYEQDLVPEFDED